MAAPIPRPPPVMIITPAIARIILDNVDDIRDFLGENEALISEELDNRQLRRAQQGD